MIVGNPSKKTFDEGGKYSMTCAPRNAKIITRPPHPAREICVPARSFDLKRVTPLKAYVRITRAISLFVGDARGLLFAGLVSALGQLPDITEGGPKNMRGGRAVDARLEKLAFARLEAAAAAARLQPRTPAAPTAAAAVIGETRGAHQRSPQQADEDGAAAGAPAPRARQQELNALAGASRAIGAQMDALAMPAAPRAAPAPAPTRRSTRERTVRRPDDG